MTNYWCAFRLAADKSYRSRYEAFLTAAFALCDKGAARWSEASYFLAFQSSRTLDEVARHMADAIDPARDVLVVGTIGSSDARYVGALNHADAFRALFPDATALS
jgi:hypothetical protein